LTLQKHLHVSDHYSGLHVMHSDDLGRTWSAPDPRPELAWRTDTDGATLAVCDVTPGWHAATEKVLSIGAHVPYNAAGDQLTDDRRRQQTAYAAYDPMADSWSTWQILQMPANELFRISRCACAQWLVEPDGALLLPLYAARNDRQPYAVTVARCVFDGQTMSCVEHGTVLELPEQRGLCEPSLVCCAGRYLLTIRNDLRGYVAASGDGLQFDPIRSWTFDDGIDLGSYNTQQHWLTHDDAPYLVYTRRGLNNDHVCRHRAPLVIARVDMDTLTVVRETEQTVIAEHGVPMGNFGATAVTADESWVTVSEFMWPDWNDEGRKRGACGRTLLARIRW